MKLYVKRLLTNTSYLYIYGVHVADFNAQQLSIVAALCELRDFVARRDDESTGYILPNETLLKIAREMPLTVSEVEECVKSYHSHPELNPHLIVELIKSSIQNASGFESAVQFLKSRQLPTPIEHKMAVDPTTSSPQRRTGDGTNCGVNGKTDSWQESTGKYVIEEYPKLHRGIVECSRTLHVPSFQPSGEVRETRKIKDGNGLDLQNESFPISEQTRGILTDNANPDSTKAIPRATEKVVDSPSNDFIPRSSTPSSQDWPRSN